MNECDYFKHMCRLCLTKNPQNFDIFGEEGDNSGIQSKIQSLFSVLVKPEEELPRKICGECLKTVDFITTYKLSVENAQITLMSLLSELTKTADKVEEASEHAVLQTNFGSMDYEERSSVDNSDEQCGISEDSDISEDMDRSSEHIKQEQSCENERTSKNYLECVDNQSFPPNQTVIEFVDVHQLDERYSPTDSEELSESDNSSESTEINNRNRRKRKTAKEIKASKTSNLDNDQLHNKTVKQSTWTSSMEEEVQNFYQFTCELCSLQPLRNFSSLCRHYRSEHDTEGYLKCCKRKMYCRTHLYQHMILHTRPEMYKCPECNKQLCGPINLKQHLQVFHLPKAELPFRCSVCARGFATKTAVENHEKSQHFLSQEEKFVHECDICGKRFASISGLAVHKKQVHQQIRPLLCDICAKAFPNQSRLRKHMTSHSGSENVKCPHCDRRLKNSGRLQVHMKRHQGVVHSCHLCEKSYPTRRLLQRHIKTHSDERPHECSVCGKRYRESSHLKMHLNQHTGAMPFSCQWCPKRFSASGPYYTHRKKMHPEQLEMARANFGQIEAAQPS